MKTISQKAVLLVLVLTLASCGLAVSTEERMLEAQASMEAGEYRGAVIQLRSVLVDEPDHIEARLALAKVLIGLGDLPTAEKELQRAVELGAPALDIERVHFSLLEAQGDFRELLAGLARDEIVLPEDEQLSLRGEALLGLREGVAAEETFRELLALSPDLPAAGVGLLL